VSALWYLTRATGAVSLLLLTASFVLGVLDIRRITGPRTPRFVIDGLHRTVSLLVLAFLTVHIGTTLIDGFAPIALVDVVVPFHSAYRPVWLGLGAAAFDLLVALVVTSLVRRRLGQRAWRAIHWIAYACWPVAFVHGLGTGSDVKPGWLLYVSLACLGAVLIALALRAAPIVRRRGPAPVLPWAAVLSAGLLGLVVWLPGGPLGPGWARRAGTPVRLLAAPASATQAASASVHPVPAPALPARFDSALHGTLRRTTDAGGDAVVTLTLRLSDPAARATVRLRGTPLAGGGLSLTSGTATVGPPGAPDQYDGSVAGLEGGTILLAMRSPGRTALTLRLTLSIAGTAVDGRATAVPAEAGTG
jgi:methionine sulfoxide reductase heme-binding subunit